MDVRIKVLVKGLAKELDISESHLEKLTDEVRKGFGGQMISKRGMSKLAVTALVFVIAMTAAHAQQGPWIRHEAGDHGVIVFVHGLLGDERSTWTSGNFYWPEMLTHDRTFDGQDIYVYHYPSPRFGQAFTIDELADNMRLVLTADGVLHHSEITFVAHSMGGIVTRAYILRYRQVVPKIRFLYFFATPTTGSSYARLGGLVSQNPQFKELYPMSADSYLTPLQGDWEAAGLKLKSYCAFETQPLYGQIIVDRQSATNLCTEHFDPIDADHYNIVKPRDRNSTPYLALKAAFTETAPSNTAPASKSAHSLPNEPKPLQTPKVQPSSPPAPQLAAPVGVAQGGVGNQQTVMQAPITQQNSGGCNQQVIGGNGNTNNCNTRTQYPDLTNAQAHVLVDALAPYAGRQVSVLLVDTGASQETLRFGTHLINTLSHCGFKYSGVNAFVSGSVPVGISATLSSDNLDLLKAIEAFLRDNKFIDNPIRYDLVNKADSPLTIVIAEPQQKSFGTNE